MNVIPNTFYQKSTNDINFKAGIKVVSCASEFKKNPLQELRSQGKYVGAPWRINTSAKFMEEGYSDEASVCTEGFIRNDKIGLFIHLQPDFTINTREAITKCFEDAVSALRKQGGQVRAFLTGGSAAYKDSCKLFEIIKNVISSERVNVPYSCVWGTKMKWGYTDLHASIAQNKYILNTNLDSPKYEYKEMLNENFKFTPTIIESIDDLKKFYKEVELLPEDNLIT